MRFLKKLIMKLVMMVVMVALMGAVMRVAKPYIMKAAGMPEGMPGIETMAGANFSSEESDLMGAIFKSALRLFTGKAKRDELAGELSDKLYGGRPEADHMSELGIELVKPGGNPATGTGKSDVASSSPPAATVSRVESQRRLKSTATKSGQSALAEGGAAAKNVANGVRGALVDRIWDKGMANPEIAFVPFAILGMLIIHIIRRRRSPEDDFLLPDLSNLIESEAEAYTMKHPVHLLGSEVFELMVALIYQRQGYRVSMPAGLGSGRGGDFLLTRKSERLLVQCKNIKQDDKLSVDRVQELHEAATAAGVTRGMYVVSGGFSWDARNFAKTKGMTLINGRTLDLLIPEAFEKNGDDLLAVSQWAPKLMSKVKLTPPTCPACEAPMDEITVSERSAWLCSERPECRARRSARKSHFENVAIAPPTQDAEAAIQEGVVARTPLRRVIKPTACVRIKQPSGAPVGRTNKTFA